jgi:hypothetical protein
MMNYPYVGQKTFDILKIIDLLREYGHEEIHLAGKGWGSVPVTFAALLSDNVKQVTLKNALTSYGLVAESEEYNWPFSAFLPGVLRHFDLPDCYKELENKKFLNIEPWGAVTDVKLTR